MKIILDPSELPRLVEVLARDNHPAAGQGRDYYAESTHQRLFAEIRGAEAQLAELQRTIAGARQKAEAQLVIDALVPKVEQLAKVKRLPAEARELLDAILEQLGLDD